MQQKAVLNKRLAAVLNRFYGCITLAKKLAAKRSIKVQLAGSSRASASIRICSRLVLDFDDKDVISF